MQEIKLIVAGGRDFNDYAKASGAIIALADGLYGHDAVSLVSGMARGADALAVRFAREFSVKLYEFHADWDKLGKGAGFARNSDMAQFSDHLLAFWDGKSRGTKHMIETMQRLNKRVTIIYY